MVKMLVICIRSSLIHSNSFSSFCQTNSSRNRERSIILNSRFLLSFGVSAFSVQVLDKKEISKLEL